MEGSAGAPPQRVCPKCARISWATGPQCPYCRARFARPPGVRPWMLVATAAVVLLGVLAMFLIAGNRFEDRVDDVNRQVERQLNDIRDDVRKELNEQGGATTPTPSPFPTPTPTPVPTETPTTETPTPDAGATATPTETIGP
ncbi:MAG TPA: hypothetical protein VFZ00_27670 [Solirubrobacter sp.]|nr:hypothetical protein [Solirubrobacter sp.]